MSPELALDMAYFLALVACVAVPVAIAHDVTKDRRRGPKPLPVAPPKWEGSARLGSGGGTP